MGTKRTPSGIPHASLHTLRQWISLEERLQEGGIPPHTPEAAAAIERVRLRSKENKYGTFQVKRPKAPKNS